MTRALALSLCVLASCGGAPSAFRSTLAATSAAVREADAQAAPAYGREADECLDSSSTRAEYDECMGPMNAVATSLVVTKSALFTAQAALDSWDDQEEEGAAWYAFVPCLAASLRFLVDTLESAGLALPEAIAVGLDFALSFGGQCGGGR